MVLALDYMRRSGQAHPETERRAREKIEVGYQRLLGFEVPTERGGFDWWGKAPANLFLTAYGLMGFQDLAAVHPVDPGLIPRITAWLRARQGADGSWSPEGVRAARTTDMAKGRSFHLTAYVAWGLARAGSPSAPAMAWLEREAPAVDDPYGLALAALAFFASDPASPAGRALVDRLVAARRSDDVGVRWFPEGETGVGARGESAAIETTALAIQALLADGRHGAPALSGLDRLVAWRGKDGRFGTTQSTILALQALLAAEPAGRRGDVEVLLEDARDAAAPRAFRLPGTSTEPVHADLDREPAEGLRLRHVGDGRTRATVSRTSWLPWDAAAPERRRLDLEVDWPAEALPAGRTAEAVVTVRNRTSDATASVVTLEVGIPPGCDVEPENVRGEGAERIEREETRIVIYLRSLPPGESRTFRIGFSPRYELDVLTAPSKAYEYYVPEEAVVVPPRRVRAKR